MTLRRLIVFNHINKFKAFCSNSLLHSLFLFFFSIIISITYVVTYSAPQAEFCSVWWVINFQWALSFSRASWQFALSFAGNEVPRALALVTRLTEVRIAPAEPLRDGATELALELNQAGSVNLAIGCTHSQFL